MSPTINVFVASPRNVLLGKDRISFAFRDKTAMTRAFDRNKNSVRSRLLNKGGMVEFYSEDAQALHHFPFIKSSFASLIFPDM